MWEDFLRQVGPYKKTRVGGLLKQYSSAIEKPLSASSQRKMGEIMPLFRFSEKNPLEVRYTHNTAEDGENRCPSLRIVATHLILFHCSSA